MTKLAIALVALAIALGGAAFLEQKSDERIATPVHPRLPCPPNCSAHSVAVQDYTGIWRLHIK